MKSKKILTILLALILVLALCACGSAKNSYSYSTASGSTADYAYAPYPMEEPSAAYDEYAMADWDAAEMEEYGGFSANTSAQAASGTNAGTSAATTINPEKIIYSANAQLETTTFDETVTEISRMIEAYGGFVESSSVNGANYYNRARGNASLRSASYTIRGPRENFLPMMNTLPTLGNSPYTNTYTENVTSQYYDVQARLKAYQAQEDRLIEMMSVAETVEDIITIEDRLTEIRYEIDSMQSRLNNWDRRVSYSTIYLDVSEVSEYTPTETVKVTYGEKLAAAVKNGLETVGNFFARFLLWLVEALPTLILLAVLAGIVLLIIHRCRATKGARQQKKARKAAEKAVKKAVVKQPAVQPVVQPAAPAAEKDPPAGT